jgi:hypothetical protein
MMARSKMMAIMMTQILVNATHTSPCPSEAMIRAMLLFLTDVVLKRCVDELIRRC